MKHRSIRLLAAIAGLVVFCQIVNFCFLRGSDIDGLTAVSPSACTAKVFTTNWEYPDNPEEYILDSAELSQLKALLESSFFTRFLRSGKPVQIADGTKLYTVCFYFEDPEDTLILHVTGNEYFSSSALAGGEEVRIINRTAWKKTFDAILAE